jgi:hypothetical protein
MAAERSSATARGRTLERDRSAHRGPGLQGLHRPDPGLTRGVVPGTGLPLFNGLPLPHFAAASLPECPEPQAPAVRRTPKAATVRRPSPEGVRGRSTPAARAMRSKAAALAARLVRPGLDDQKLEGVRPEAAWLHSRPRSASRNKPSSERKERAVSLCTANLTCPRRSGRVGKLGYAVEVDGVEDGDTVGAAPRF